MAESEFNIDNIIDKLVEARDQKPGKQINIDEADVKKIISQSRDIFINQPILLELDAPLKICGDIHGQFYDLLRIFENAGYPPESNYLFLGDYIDRGKQSLECIILLLSFKIKYPENFFLLRGNHECSSINRIYGFYDECKRRYNVRLWKQFTDCFNCMPVVGLVDEKILCMHGGISPELTNLDQIPRIQRPLDVPDQGWADNERGVSYVFGPDVCNGFLKKQDLDLICRAHQVVEDGYEFFGKRQLVTVFSAPNYCGEFDNAAAVMCVDEQLMCSFTIIRGQKGGRTKKD